MTHPIEFSHAFQPIINLAENRIFSYESLLRGKNNEPPFHVFNQVPATDLMAFDQINRETSLATAAKLGLKSKLNLNFSPGSILYKDGYYPLKTLETAASHGIAASNLVLEITEGEVVENRITLHDVLNRLRREQIIVAIDDFGAGYSGLNMLADIQPDMIKLDMQLIRNIDNNGPRQSIVRAINHVCLDLGIEVLAEGIETLAELEFLLSEEIELYQGFLLAKPAFENLPTKWSCGN